MYFITHWMAVTHRDKCNHFIVQQTKSEPPFLSAPLQINTLFHTYCMPFNYSAIAHNLVSTPLQY